MNRPVYIRAAFDIGIDREDPEPIQAQIARQLRDLVLSGRLRPQTSLPSTRGLAAELGVARATVVEAYEQLAGEGYIEMQQGSGTQVAAELPEQLLQTRAGKSGEHYKAPQRPRRKPALPFQTGLVDWSNFPHEDWGKRLGRIWRNPPLAALEHDDPFGWLPLREAIARHVYEWRGISCLPSQVVVTAGGTDAFDLISRALLHEGGDIWMEDPGYPTARQIFSQRGLTTVSIPVDAEGLQIGEGLRRSPQAVAAFVTPSRQYPLGVTMPLSRRLELLDWAERKGAYVVEDDYDSEYRYVGRPLPALSSLARCATVIYVGSFSKVFSPLLRLGFILVPPQTVSTFVAARDELASPPSLLPQLALAQFMADGSFAAHIRRMRRLYAQHRAALIKALEPGNGRLFEIDAPPAGLMLCLHLLQGDDRQACQALREEAIESQSLSDHYATEQKRHGLLLGFAGFNETRLAKAGEKLLAVLERCLAS